MEHFLYFTKGERIGILVLMVLCIGLFVLPAYLPDRSQTEQTDFTAFKEDINRWYDESETATNLNKESHTSLKKTSFNPNQVKRGQLLAHGLPQNTIRSWLSYTQKGGRFNTLEDLMKFRALANSDLDKLKPYLVFTTKLPALSPNGRNDKESPISYFPFDPHTVTKKELISLGLSDKTAYNWTKYTSNGGFFNQATDIQKIYGLSEADYLRLLPYVVLKDKVISAPIATNDQPRSYENKAYTSVIIDINQATAEEWQQLRGIGPAFSKRIVNFRDKLGGFHSINQVAETYGLPDSVFQAIQLFLRPSPLLRKLAINQLSDKELAAHPYIRFNDANIIVQYRKNHGAFKSTADLKKLYALKAETILKITPYLSFE